MRISAILLAAGLSSRMEGKDKLMLEYKGKSLLQHALGLLDSLPCETKIIVTTQARLGAVSLPQGVQAVVNPFPEGGQSGSLKLGLCAADADAYLFLNADQPKLSAEGLAWLFELARENPDKIIYPSVREQPSTPVLFPARFRGELLALGGDTGGRAVRNTNADACLTVEVEEPGDFVDVDTLEDYGGL